MNNMTVYKCDIYEIQKHTQVKAILLTFTIESSSSYFLIHSVYNTHALVAEFDYVRPRNKFFECFTIFCLIKLDTPLIPSRFVARRRTGLLSYLLEQMMFLV